MDHREQPVPRPSDDVLIDTYLLSKIAGDLLPGDIVIHEADVYSDYPYELVRRYAPAHGAGHEDGSSMWYFFSPVRYASDNRRWRKVGPDGKGVWHPEGRAKDAKGSSTGGTLQKLTYKEKTASAVVKPGWLMTEYAAASQEHGHGGQLVLCKIYRSPRGQGSDAPLRGTTATLSGHKRKADAGLSLPQQQRQDDCFMSAHHPPQIPAGPGDVDAFVALRALMETDEDDSTVQLPANFDPREYLCGEQHQPEAAVPAAPMQCIQSTSPGDEASMPSCSAPPEECDDEVLTKVREFMETDDDKMGVQLPANFDPAEYLLGEQQQQQPSVAVPPCSASPSEECQQSTSEGDDVIEFTLDELMGTCSSAPSYDPWMTPALCAF